MGISDIHVFRITITCLLQGTLCDTGIPCTLYGENICSVRLQVAGMLEKVFRGSDDVFFYFDLMQVICLNNFFYHCSHPFTYCGQKKQDNMTCRKTISCLRIYQILYLSSKVIKFIYSEKATKFCEISTLLLSYLVPVKSKLKILQNFVIFSEYMNFKTKLFKLHRC